MLRLRPVLRGPGLSFAGSGRRLQSNNAADGFVRATAPLPIELGPPPPSPARKHTGSGKPRRWRQRLAYTTAGLAVLFTVDYNVNESALIRTLRCAAVLSVVAADYKLNFEEGKDIEALHTRSANRIYDLVTANGGLYIKMGQAIAMQASVLPAVFQRKFSRLFDMAPQDPWAEIERLFEHDFGRMPDEVFRSIEHRPVASASVAQVHKAQLITGEWVAVKIQHPKIETQVWWDLSAYKAMMYLYDRFWFDMPVYFTVAYTCNRLAAETDFRNEARNAENLRAKLETEPSLRSRVYIPRLYEDLCSEHVLTTEWIDGVAMSNQAELDKRGWNKTEIMDTMVNLFAAQIFRWGVVHCDPHPGNIILRPRTPGSKKLELVLIDHGLYIYERDEFRREYCQLWTNMFIFNDAAIREIIKGWGIGSFDLFTTSVMLRPYRGDRRENSQDKPPVPTTFEQQTRMKEQMKNFLTDSTKMPLELLFLGRNMRIVQACNMLMGSPVNRVKILAEWASSSQTVGAPGVSWRERVRAWWSHIKFMGSVAGTDAVFYIARARQVVLRQAGAGFEDMIQRRMKGVAREQFGMEIADMALAEGVDVVE
ncbi:ABC1 family-domain-containing protein [Limtongia smithiae]|uniref:ABC1 family-domain-containing protein n=1 Tax=Limtongia smithiae TaxID=1125753 RepID=UPI0034CEAB29